MIRTVAECSSRREGGGQDAVGRTQGSRTGMGGSGKHELRGTLPVSLFSTSKMGKWCLALWCTRDLPAEHLEAI